MARLKADFSEQIEELQTMLSEASQKLVEVNWSQEYLYSIKYRKLLEVILDKECRIQELEEQNEDLEAQIRQREEKHGKIVDISEYNQVMTLNSALQRNLKSQTAQVNALEESNKQLTVKSI